MNATRNTFPARTRKASVALVNFTELEFFLLPVRPKQTHWNVLGPSFIRLHLLDELAVTMNQFRRSAKKAALGELRICQSQPAT